ncbi:condensin complex subunit 3 [Anopheles nili]|uniref:condensin complex subunit 3 n=1 Tax=Anopheles nili TaxID=185578 RepID=UPI00237A6FA9|nr:condensin complex subunit 3 [Anopheles nili]
MAPRKRKVVLAATNSPEKVKYSTAVIQTLLNAQQNEVTHAKLIKQLKQLYATVVHDSFMKSFIQVVKRQMEHEEINSYANNILKFCAKFVADPEYSEQTVTHPVMSTFFNWLLGTISSAQLVRFRICQLVNLFLNALGPDAALDDAICDKILRYMLERMRDVSQHVRVQAVLALQRLQDPNSPEDSVVRAYLYHLDKDPSPKVRQTIISSLGRNYRSIPHILDRLWDVDQRVRRHTYMQMSSFPVRQYKVAQRLKFLEQGLIDHSDGVRKVVRNVMIPQWIESYQCDYIAFIEALKLDADEKEMERFRKTSKMVLMEIFSKKSSIKEMAGLLQFSEENKTVPLAELTIERAICWQAMLEYLKSTDSDDLEEYMVELSKFCEYIEALFNNPTEAAFMKGANNTTVSSNQPVSPNRSETMDKLQQLYFQNIVHILLEIVSIYDFGDEFGRESLKKVLSEVLCNETLFEMNVRIIVETYERLITDVEMRLSFFVDLVSTILEPARQDFSNSSRLLVDTFLERHPELKPLKLQISALRVKILELQEQESSLSAQKDYAGAQLANEALNTCNEEYANLVKPLLQDLSASNSNETSSSTTFRETMLKTRRVTQASIEKCLQVCFYFVNSPTVRVITPTVCDLYRTFISRHVQSGQLHTRNWALRASTAFSMLYDGLSKETFQLLYQQFLNTASTRLWKTAIECVFELLDRYGFEHFDLENEETNKDDSSRTTKSSRQLFNRHDSSYSDELSQSTCNGNEFYKMSIHFMDTCDDDSICSTIVEGFCRLILRGKCTSSDIMSKLLLRFFNPTTDPELQQILGIFFQRLIKKRRQEIMQKALLSTLFTVLEAPNESPLAEIRPETVIKFVVDSTQPVFCSPGVNPHNTIALTFLRVMRDNVSLKDLLKLLSCELVTLDIKDDPVLRSDLACKADEILKEPGLDPRAVKKLTTFREMMLGKIRDTLTFSSSRSPADTVDPTMEEQAMPKDPSVEDELNAEALNEEEETEQDENDEEEEENRADDRPQINKSILQEDSETELMASPLKRPDEMSTPEKSNSHVDSLSESGVKSIRRSMLFGETKSPSTSAVRTADSDGPFKVPDATAIRRIQHASATRAKEVRSASRPIVNKSADTDTTYKPKDVEKSAPSSEQHVSSGSSGSDDELEVSETQATRVSSTRRKSSTARSSTRSSRKVNVSPSSSSSDDEVVEGSPNVSVSGLMIFTSIALVLKCLLSPPPPQQISRINRSPRQPVMANKTLGQIFGTLPRVTRHATRLHAVNSKVMTRKSMLEVSVGAGDGARSPQQRQSTQSPAKAKEPTSRTSRRKTGDIDAEKPATQAKNVPSSDKTVARVSRSASRKSSSPARTQPPKTTPTRIEHSPKTPTRTSARMATTNVGNALSSSPASKRKHTQLTSPREPSTRQSADTESGTSTSSPIRLKRAAVVLTPLSAVVRRMRIANGSDSPVRATSPRQPNRKATKK